MPTVKISELPAGTANSSAVVPATNAAGTTTEKITLGAISALAVSNGAAPAADPAFTGNATFAASTGVPVTITNTGTDNSFVVQDELADTTAFVIDSAGNVGVGTSTPTARIVAYSAVGTAIRATDSTSFTEFYTNGGTGALSNAGSGSLVFLNNGAERMRITPSGNLGVGTSTPLFSSGVSGAQIHVETASTASALRLTNANTTTAITGGFELQVDAVTNSYIIHRGSAEARSLQIWTHGAERMRFTLISTVPSVVIGGGDGTTTATAGLLRAPTKTGTDAVGGSFTIAGSTGTGTGGGGPIVFQTAAASGTSGTAANTLAERMRIDAAGNVGLGTNAPSMRTAAGNGLHIHATAAQAARPCVRLTNDTTGVGLNRGSEVFIDGNQHLCLQNGESASNIRLLTSGTVRVNVFGDGRINIGSNTTPVTTGALPVVMIGSDTVRLETARTITLSSATGNAGEICWDTNYLYVCIAANTWRRIALGAAF